MARPRAVIIGAGALGLGFVAERMASDYDLCVADLAVRASFLSRLVDEQGYTMNLCGPTGVALLNVRGGFSAATMESARGQDALSAALGEADLVLTAVGSRALPAVVRAISPILNARARRVWLLFCENGLDIAARHRKVFAPHVFLVDTVMSRMCRFADPEESGHAPLWQTHEQRLVAETYPNIPLDRSVCNDGPFSSVFSLVDHEEFQMWEDIKLYMHNGLHAFMAYHAFLEGAKRFPQISATIRAAALSVMQEELVPAIMTHHPGARRTEIEAYGHDLLARLVNPWFNDSIERGIRGAEEKLAPGERLLGGRDYISAAGIEPRGYSTTITAARRIVELRGA